MSDAPRISVKNWKKFQHFRDRRPPWIKLYRDILDDPEWFALSGDEAKLLVMLWVIASESDGYLPDIKRISFRCRVDIDVCKSLIAKLQHWLDIPSISERCQHDAPETEGEGETERETETDTPIPPVGAVEHASRRLTQAEKKRQHVQANTPNMVRIGSWFNRRPDTLWTVAEAEALAQVGAVADEDWAVMEAYYTADIPPKDNYRRRDVITLLNNWNGELDRARNHNQHEETQEERNIRLTGNRAGRI